MSEWQQIETAPKDGTRIMLCLPTRGGLIVFGNWDTQPHHKNPSPYWTNDLQTLYGMYWVREYQPTHWMPLPSPPKEFHKEK